MYPLILCSVLLIALAIERTITLRRASVDGEQLLEEVKELWPQDPKAATERCLKVGGPLGRGFAKALTNANRPPETIELALDQAGQNELPLLEANLPVVKTIVNISPLLGLLGTIAGMITSFRAASAQGLSNPSQILGGISEALISTATGISLAVIGFLIYNYFANQSKKVVEDLEFYGGQLVNFLTGRIE